ncbi:amidohydrolase family protein [Amycolatopsis sp. DSM 110486]|uniref:amidohydrolase family protein n=1 Tax=Amycolatopsis sp. DSM 110486 TaxID=2865832 RepID=UPI001C69C7F1|nr:amidohydrolase family protein [Amycolatopsis sp. DSM 110486]QYN26412.1 amidohydrolase family protein [Amycolatopsis sp. DSM 110486]
MRSTGPPCRCEKQRDHRARGPAPLHARQCHHAVRRAHLGTIGRGKLADVVVLDTDPLSVDPGAIKDIGVDLTVVDGRVVYEKA